MKGYGTTERIRKALALQPMTKRELAAHLKVGFSAVESLLYQLLHRGDVEAVSDAEPKQYQLIGEIRSNYTPHVQKKPEPIIANNEYAMPTRRQFNGYAGYPGGTSHRGSGL